jgi:outer membrane protein assembly factor BamB
MGNFKSSSLLLLVSILSIFFPLFAQEMDWTIATDSAQWHARGYHTSVVFDNKMWVIGGFNSTRRNDVWYSEDGINWTEATASAPWAGRMGHTSVVFDNKIWVIGGYSGSLRNDVWYSEDGVNWTQATAAAEWSARCYFTSVVFDNKIWILGGYNGNNLNDVWFSSDGVNWICATDSAEWPARYDHTSLVFNNKMWILGGTNYLYQLGDVWYSTDGVQWTLATDNAVWNRDGPTSVVFNNKMWVIGGYDYLNEVWYSSTGDTWLHATNVAPWSERAYHTSVVFDDKIWVLGGIDEVGRRNDVWFSRGVTNLVSPNGGEILVGGNDYTIHWQTIGSNFACYRLLFSTYFGLTYYDTIAYNIPPTETTFLWQVPEFSTTICRVKVQALDSNGLVIRQDASDANFTIATPVYIEFPNGGELFAGGSDLDIWWYTAGTGFSKFRLLLSRNAGHTYPDTIAQNVPPSQSYYIGTTPRLNSSFCRVKVQVIDTINRVVTEDESDDNFTIYSHIQLASYQYPMFRYNLQHTAQCPFLGSQTSNVRWYYSTNQPITSSPIVASDSTIYFSSENDTFYAIKSDGTKRWQNHLGEGSQSTPAIATDSTIYIGNAEGQLVAFPFNLSEHLWTYSTGGSILSSPVIDANGIIFVGSSDGYLYAFNAYGTLKWRYNVGTAVNSSPAITSSNGTIYMGSNQGTLYAINPNGTRTWEIILPDALLSSPAIGWDGTIYIGCCNGKLYAVDRYGVVKWSYQTSDSIISSAAIDTAGRIYFGSCDGYVYVLEDAGNQANLIWRFQTQGKIRSSPSISANGIIYIGSDDGNIYAINQDGTLAWIRITGNAVRSSPAIGADGTIYIGSDDGRLYAIGLVPGIKENEVVNLKVPKSFILYSGKPNPFALRTTIRFGLSRTSKINLKIYSSSGILLMTLISETRTQGYHNTVWDGKDNFGKTLPAGIYFCRLETEGIQEIKKIVKLE